MKTRRIFIACLTLITTTTIVAATTTSEAHFDEVEFGRRTRPRSQSRQLEEIVETEAIFRELVENDILFFSMSMSMSMSMIDGLSPTTATTISDPTDGPSTIGPSATAIVNETLEDTDPVVPDEDYSFTPEPIESSLKASRITSDSPTTATTAVVAMASVGGVLVALLFVRRRPRNNAHYLHMDTKEEDGWIPDNFSFAEPSRATNSPLDV